MAINRVWIENGCISCGLCVDLCPDVFRMEDEAMVNQGVPYNDFEKQVKEAAEECPVEVIKYEWVLK